MPFTKNLTDKVRAAKAFIGTPNTSSSELASTNQFQPVSGTVKVNVDKVISNILASIPLDSFPTSLKQTFLEFNTSRPSVAFGLFRRLGSHSRTKTYAAQADEIGAMVSMMQNQAVAFQQAFNNARLPELATRQVQIHTAVHQNALIALAQQAIMAKLAIRLHVEAMQEGLSLELYLKRLEEQDRLTIRQAEIDQDIDKDQRLKAITRQDEAEMAIIEIEMSTRASLAAREQEKALRKELREAYVRRDRITQGFEPETDTKLSEALRADYLEEVTHDILSLEAKIERFAQVDSEADSET
jgi:hypothetical protein